MTRNVFAPLRARHLVQNGLDRNDMRCLCAFARKTFGAKWFQIQGSQAAQPLSEDSWLSRGLEGLASRKHQRLDTLAIDHKH